LKRIRIRKVGAIQIYNICAEGLVAHKLCNYHHFGLLRRFIHCPLVYTMTSIPVIESEVDFHVEEAGKPCKTVWEMLSFKMPSTNEYFFSFRF
jgi:hypothetical protein